MKTTHLSGREIVEAMRAIALGGTGITTNLNTGMVIEGREKFEMERALLKTEAKFIAVCAACGAEFDLIEAQGCACGGFICADPACLATIGDETCDHDLPEGD